MVRNVTVHEEKVLLVFLRNFNVEKPDLQMETDAKGRRKISGLSAEVLSHIVRPRNMELKEVRCVDIM